MLRWCAHVLIGSLSLSLSLGTQERMTLQAREADTSLSSLVNGVYRNATFGFTYKPPFGWVDRTAEMQEDDPSAKPGNPQSQLLLAVFERPPETTGSTVNSAVVIVAESTASYPGLKTAADYFVSLEEVTKAKGFTAVNEPYEFSVGTKKLGREDFSKPLGQLTMQQASLVLVQKGYVVSFTFIGGSEEEVEELVEGLKFGQIQPSGTAHPSKPKK